MRDATPFSVGRLVAEQDSVVWEGPSKRPATVQQATAKFVVRNVGGRPVRVVEVTSSCGCATPSVTPALIPPGETSIVAVEATPILVGEKVATIALKTDSPETPEVSLKLHIVGNRRPPFLLRAGGELTFMGDFSAEDTREFLVVMIVPEAEKTPPVIGNSADFLSVSAPTVTTKPHSGSGIVEKHYFYRVAISGEPPVGVYRGEITATDPWDKDRKEHVVVSIEKPPAFRVVPSHLLLATEADGSAAPSTFVVMSRTAIPDLAIEIDGGKASPLVAEMVKMSDDRRMATCRLGLKKGSERGDGPHEIRLRPSPSSKDGVHLSVMIKGVKP